MTEDKKPVTTLKSVLNSNELEMLNQARGVWQKLTGDSTNRLQDMADIGYAIELIYSKGRKKGLKKQEITTMVNLSFPGLSAVERSEFRKLNKNIEQVSCFVRDTGIKSCNTSYLISSYVKAVKEDCQSCKDIEAELRRGLIKLASDSKESDAPDSKDSDDSKESDAPDSKDSDDSKESGAPDSDNSDDGKRKKIILGDVIKKEGYDNIVRPIKSADIVENFGLIVNQLKTLFNEDKLSADQKIEIDKHGTSLLKHMAGIDASSSEFDKIAI